MMTATTFKRFGLSLLGTHPIHRTGYNMRRYSSTLTNILADENPPPVQVASITEDAIRLANGLRIPGACIFLEGKVLIWNVPTTLWDGWDTHHFKVFEEAGSRPGTFTFIKQCTNTPLIRVKIRYPASGNWKNPLTGTSIYSDISEFIRDSP
jgi:hypothetical protein